jgi:hypothetical protein
MKGGAISGNTSTGGSITSYGGGGGGVAVHDHCTFTMEGGSITDNSAEVGGGLVVSHYAKGSMTGGSITENTASKSGGGLAIPNAAFSMKGEAAITDNTSMGGGGGVMMDAAASFTMENGIIARNIAQGTATGPNIDYTYGGGIYISKGTFSMTGGFVYGTDGGENANKVSTNGYGAALWNRTLWPTGGVNTTITSYP